MSRGLIEAIVWICVYLVATILPLAVVMLVDTPPGRGFWTEFSSALGFVGLAMITLQFVLTTRIRRFSWPYGMDIVLQFHRQISLVAGALLLGHVVVLFVTRPETIALLNIIEAPWRARFAVISMVALATIVISSIWREALGLSYERWRLLHGTLAVVAVATGLAHVVGVGYYLELAWKQWMWIAMVGVAIAALAYIRIGKPITQLHRPWEVEDVREERGETWTLALRPVGHDGIAFQAGQFAWITLYTSPLVIREHPFSFSSSSESVPRIEFTIKALGDFTNGIRHLEPGTRAYLDGPHGAFTIRRHPADGYVFIAGGIGITPIMSMLRTLADRRDERPLLLIYGNESWDGITFREELDDLTRRLDLEVVHVLRDPPDGWEGETGYVDRAVIERHLPDLHTERFYFLCGPQVMMATVEDALLELDVPLDRTLMERFDLV
jgi:predicted ferric reductase